MKCPPYKNKGFPFVPYFCIVPKALAIVIEETQRKMNWHWKEIKMYPFASDMISWVRNPTIIYIYNRHTHAHGQMLVKLNKSVGYKVNMEISIVSGTHWNLK